jgi:predicted 2-oxoglutarate/Fe(II)-dependent dioxygenase YbiX
MRVPDRDVLIYSGLIPWWQDLIDVCNEVGGWIRANEDREDGSEVETNHRKSASQYVSRQNDTRFALYERSLYEAVSWGLQRYKEFNHHWRLKKDCGYLVLRYGVGHSYGIHVDCYNMEQVHRAISILIYLNDDYEGGELYFPRQDIKLRLPPGSIVMFPSMGTHPHEGCVVTKGIKYVVVSWAR